MDQFFSKWIYRAIRYTLGGIFIWSGVAKLTDIQAFAVVIDAFGVIPESWVMPVSYTLPIMEILSGMGLIWDVRGSLTLITGMLVLFIGILGYGIHMGLDIDCGCFGPEDPESRGFHGLRSALYRDLVLMMGIGYLYVWRMVQTVRPVHLSELWIHFIQKGAVMRKMLKNMAVFPMIMMLSLSMMVSAEAANKFEKELEKEAGAIKLVREVQQGGYGIVSTNELKKWIDQGKDMLIIDAMPYEASYKKNHIPGAKQFLFPIPLMEKWDSAQTEGKSQADYEKLLGPDKERTIVIYCGFVKCTRSHNGAIWAKKLGYKNVYRHPGGIFAWKGAGFPVEKAD